MEILAVVAASRVTGARTKDVKRTARAKTDLVRTSVRIGPPLEVAQVVRPYDFGDADGAEEVGREAVVAGGDAPEVL